MTRVSKDDRQQVMEVAKKYIEVIEAIDPKHRQEMEVEDDQEQE